MQQGLTVQLHLFILDLKIMFDKLYVYTRGLAAFLCAGMLENESKEYFIKELHEMGGYVIGAIAFNKGLIEKYCIEIEERGLLYIPLLLNKNEFI